MNSEPINYSGEYIDFSYANGIGLVAYNVHVINIESAKEMVKERRKVMERLNRSVPILFDMRNLITVDEEAMNYLSQPSVVQRKINAGAYLISNELNAMTYNIWKQFKLPIPCKAFTVKEKAKAIAWLKQMAMELNC